MHKYFKCYFKYNKVKSQFNNENYKNNYRKLWIENLRNYYP